MDKQDYVEEFHKTFGLVAQDHPTALDEKTKWLRIRLIREEVNELLGELEAGNILGSAKEMADVLYVVYGTAVSMGINLDFVFDLVHESNMSKLGRDGQPIKREDGKILKGPDYWEPMFEQGDLQLRDR